MVWYNYNVLTQEESTQFRRNDGTLSDMVECWLEEHKGDLKVADDQWSTAKRRGIKPSERLAANAKRLRAKMGDCWIFFDALTNSLEKKVDISIKETQLQGLGKNLSHFRSCMYVSIVVNVDGKVYSHRMINLVSTANSSLIEVRPNLSYIELFNNNDWANLIAVKGVIGWQIGQPSIKLEQFKKYEILYHKLVEHFVSVRDFIANGGQFAIGGESRIEATIKEDLAYTNKYSIRHGERPVPLEGGGRGELDLLVERQLGDAEIRLALEIQGPEHYGEGFNAGNEAAQINRIRIDQQKIEWCIETERMFVWMDWETMTELLIMDGPQLRDYEDRRKILRYLMKYLIDCHNNGICFVALFGTRRKNRVSPIEYRIKFFLDNYGDLNPKLVDVMKDIKSLDFGECTGLS